jgi:hypothetical protein
VKQNLREGKTEEEEVKREEEKGETEREWNRRLIRKGKGE